MPRTSQPPTSGVSWRHSLRTRMVATGALSQVLLLAGLALLLYAGIRMDITRNSHKETEGLAQQTARGLQATMESVQVSGRILAAHVGTAGHQPFVLRSLLLGTLSGDGDITGAAVVIEPGAFKDGKGAFAWHVERTATGMRDDGSPSVLARYRDADWYKRTLRDDVTWWSEPYLNGDGGRQYLSTFNLPLHLLGEMAGTPPSGLVSVDVPMERLRAIVRELPADTGLQPMLFSPGGMIVMHPDPSLAFRRTIATQVRLRRPDLAPLAQAVAQRRSLSFQHVAPDGGHYITHVMRVGDTGWTFALSASQDFALAGLNRVALVTGLVGLLALALWLLLIGRYARALTQPIEDITDSAQHFHNGEFDYPLEHLERPDEVGVMARAFDAARTSIRDQFDEIGRMTAARERMQSELEIARDIQQAMLPPGRTFDSDTTHLEAAALLEPAKTVGGDFYHFFETAPGQLWFVIGDVSDKGVPAALFMARALTVLEVAARRYTRPDAILAAAAQRLAEHNETCMFATVLCGLIHVDSSDYWIASAGHEPPLLLEADGTVATLPLECGPPLGIDSDLSFPVLHARMAPGQTLLGYTDGVTDALDAQQRNYGEARLAAALRAGRSAAEQCVAVLEDIRRFTGDADQFDDITLLAIRLRQEPNGTDEPS